MAKLSDLKTLLHSVGSKPRPAAPPPAGAGPGKRAAIRAAQSDPDIDLSRAFADVAPLPSRNRARIDKARPAPTPAKRLADEADALAASKFGTEPSPSSWEIGQEQEAQQTFLRPGLGADVLVRLRRGHWSVQGELDLHRLTSNEAHDALADFLFDARGRGLRCVRVIHGKGLSSPNREPVLKSKVRRWLSQWDEVLAYCEAPRHGGGGGAVVVLLKAPPG
ncbi:MAG TPA: Smr/MutS family protein [Casimicrobiaceae bacterium]|jgi:DNA-nicking Smr family endonuclease|nr:Smr/MutS family protein [Casimicrobiaceae bacterium]